MCVDHVWAYVEHLWIMCGAHVEHQNSEKKEIDSHFVVLLWTGAHWGPFLSMRRSSQISGYLWRQFITIVIFLLRRSSLSYRTKKLHKTDQTTKILVGPNLDHCKSQCKSTACALTSSAHDVWYCIPPDWYHPALLSLVAAAIVDCCCYWWCSVHY